MLKLLCYDSFFGSVTGRGDLHPTDCNPDFHLPE